MFNSTHWSLVLAAGLEQHPRRNEGWEYLAREYWYPLYVFARRSGQTADAATDLTQGFFAELLQGDLISRADPARGRFRSLLLTSFKNYLRMEHRAARAEKRGGSESPVPLDTVAAEGCYISEPEGEWNPEELFERRWVFQLLERTLDRLTMEFATGPRAALFARLQASLMGDRAGGSYAEIANEFAMTEGAVKAAVHRLRQRFRSLLREEVAATVRSAADIEEELQHIAQAVSL
jgi:RNA polymerase sigma factor (sigma-70 family)